ncbi:hypothetical protein ACVRXQ_02790 [Streptococcus panodentis]|uniref:Uncharacterized protein n=1 Tax=Streptococcus panodentis TaxID=1581472 RepID=A0ABS5B1C8_9STRE|nr:hypothetical protein [Streptococcus panodentis]MBP2621784.1 hypothetical protein [Streptococcus panodentis]
MELDNSTYVMLTSYLIENLYLDGLSISQIEKHINSIKVYNRDSNEYPKPKNLEFLDAKHDYRTGMTGVAFRDISTGKIIIGYTGTNLRKGEKDKDLILTDIIFIGLGVGGHYESAFKFYDYIASTYGKPSLVTGHSLGGNYAQRSA